MKIKFLLFAFLFSAAFTASSQTQTLEELNAQKATLEAQISSLKTQVEEIDNTIKKDFPDWGWKKGLFGTFGVNLTGFNNWVTAALPESRNTTIQGSFNAFANKIEE